MASQPGQHWWRRLTTPLLGRARATGMSAARTTADMPRRARSKEERDRDHAERRALHLAAKRRADEERDKRRREQDARREEVRQARERTIDAAYANYRRVRDWAERMRGEASPHIDAMTEPERRMHEALAPLWRADRQTIAELRRWSDPLQGAPAAEPGTPSVEYVERLTRQVTILRKQNGAETLVPEPGTLGECGAVVAGQRHSDETIKFAVVVAALKHAAVLTPFQAGRGRRIVWEIGGGWGGFAYHFKTMCPNVTYLITGRLERLLVSAVYLMSVWPQARVRLVGEPGAGDPWSDWEHVDVLFAPDDALDHLHPPRLDLTVDIGELHTMTTERARAHLRTAYEWGSPYVYSMLPAAAAGLATTPWSALERWYWPHPVPLRSDRSVVHGEAVAHEDDYAHMVGWRRLRP